MNTKTIVAQCSPSGSGAIALLRISGPHALAVVNECATLSSKAPLSTVPSHTIHHGWVVDADKKLLDEVLFLVMHAPRTFTGEHTVEITCHNNQFLIDLLIQRIIACGAQPAQPGEFSRTAVENNKIDILQAEAINELIHANSQQGLKQALSQLEGSLSSWIANLEINLLHLMALCEASFEFLEEDVDFSDQIRTSLTKILSTIDHVKTNFNQQHLLRQGVRIALIGTVNAGKSSLFNVLVGKKRAIVTDIAGTTRDVIETSVFHKGLYWTFVDTAGLRQTEDIIEQEGIKKSYEEAALADLIILVVDNSRTLSESELTVYQTILNLYATKTILVLNKADLTVTPCPLVCPETFSISTKTGAGIETLTQELSDNVMSLFTEKECPFLLNQRHMILLESFEQKLKEAQALCATSIEYELLAYHLKDALSVLSELTGKSVSEKTMDTIFKDFCVGK